ncbi:L-fuculose-phosphate aldolase [Murinocardiopsis flavida]|uniref:L-fuculose-phosphate aldolase n=1 Tax=Murinocardiopsis flavida TaxID=645275 RepID=A0A2P8CJ88_9ACTN|nr:class II aldolase/adducin family protein [Murinocardiopsis flavida]PSK85024.1 L-fuculose-phosphate aldolase [Murinocardiopsis flavida]
MTITHSVAHIGCELAAAGLTAGQAGNVSVRDGETAVVSPTNARLSHLDPGRLSSVGMSGEHLDGPRPTKEVPLHLAMYRRDPAAGVIVHVHSPAATAVSCLAPWSAHTAIAPLTPYVLMKVGQVPLIPYRAPGDPSQADLIAAHPMPFRAALLANHGSIVAAADPESAIAAAIEVEEACRVMLELRGAPARTLDHAQITELVHKNNTPWTPPEPATP